MIHTYRRKRNSLNTCSYFERLLADVAECSVRTIIIKDRLPSGCFSSRENEKAKCEEWIKRDLVNNSNFFQSQLSERLDAPPIKFKYTRRSKELHKGGRSPHHAAALPPLPEEIRSISGMDTTQSILDRLCCDSCSLDHCKNDAMRPSNLDRCCDGNLSCQIFTKEEITLDRHCSNISAIESANICASILQEPDPKSRDIEYGSSYQNSLELGGTKWAVPLQTYSRRGRGIEEKRRTYAALIAERCNSVTADRSLTGSGGCAKSLDNRDMSKKIELGESEIVIEHCPSFYQPHGKLTGRNSSVGNMLCGQVNQKVENGCRLFDDTDAIAIPSLNDEAVTDQQLDAIKSHQNICDLSLHIAYESSTNKAMPEACEAVLDNSQSNSDDPKKAGAASKGFSSDGASLNCSVQRVSCSDKPSEVDLNLAAIPKCQEAVALQSESLIHVTSLHAEDRKAIPKELLGTMSGRIKETVDLFDINVQPSKDLVSVSPMNETAYPVTPLNDSAHTKVLQLFPEETSDNAIRLNTSKSGLVPAVSLSSYSSSVTVALPELIVRREFIQDKVVESPSQARHKLLLDGIRSCNRSQMVATEGSRQNFQSVSSFWCEEELDNLWVGVRRHGKDNWYAMLKDPRLQFSPWRTERDLAEMWIMEQSKLLGDAPGPHHDQFAKPVGIQPSSVPPFLPPGPGSMTRFLTDPMQLSPSNAYLSQQGQGMYLPRPPHNIASVPGNGTRLFNRREKNRRKSQRSESTWGRFKSRNQIMPPPQFPTSLASTSSVNTLPSYIRDMVHYPYPFPRLPVTPPSAQHFRNSSQFLHISNNKGMGSSSQNGFLISNSITDCLNVAAFPVSQSSEAKPTEPRRRKELINLDSEASSEGTISDDDKPALISILVIIIVIWILVLIWLSRKKNIGCLCIPCSQSINIEGQTLGSPSRKTCKICSKVPG